MKKLSMLLIALITLPFSITSSEQSWQKKMPLALFGLSAMIVIAGGSYFVYQNYYKTIPTNDESTNTHNPTNNTIDLSTIDPNKTNLDIPNTPIIPQPDPTIIIIPSNPPITTPQTTQNNTPKEPDTLTPTPQPIITQTITQKPKSRKLMEKWLLDEKNIEIIMGGY